LSASLTAPNDAGSLDRITSICWRSRMSCSRSERMRRHASGDNRVIAAVWNARSDHFKQLRTAHGTTHWCRCLQYVDQPAQIVASASAFALASTCAAAGAAVITWAAGGARCAAHAQGFPALCRPDRCRRLDGPVDVCDHRNSASRGDHPASSRRRMVNGDASANAKRNLA
jgi:hypothetical protein